MKFVELTENCPSIIIDENLPAFQEIISRAKYSLAETNAKNKVCCRIIDFVYYNHNYFSQICLVINSRLNYAKKNQSKVKITLKLQQL